MLFRSINNEQPVPAQSAVSADAADIESNKALGVLAYILFFIPILAAKDSKFAMYHANQGLALFVCAVGANVASHFIPLMGWILVPMTSLAVLVFMVIGILNASRGEMKPLPLIGGITLLK